MSKGIEQMEKALANAAIGQVSADRSPVASELSEVTEAVKKALGTTVEGYNTTALARTLNAVLYPPGEHAAKGKDVVEQLVDLKKAGFLKEEGEFGPGVASMVGAILNDRGKEVLQVREEAKDANDRFMTLVMKLLEEGNRKEIRELADKLDKATRGNGGKSKIEETVEEIVSRAVMQNLAPALLGQQQRPQSNIAGVISQLQEFQEGAKLLRDMFKEREEDPLMKLPEHLQNPLLRPETLRLLLEDGINRARLAQDERRYEEERKSRERIMGQAEGLARQIAPVISMLVQSKVAGVSAEAVGGQPGTPVVMPAAAAPAKQPGVEI